MDPQQPAVRGLSVLILVLDFKGYATPHLMSPLLNAGCFCLIRRGAFALKEYVIMFIGTLVIESGTQKGRFGGKHGILGVL